jgi:hypothetical protein
MSSALPDVEYFHEVSRATALKDSICLGRISSAPLERRV